MFTINPSVFLYSPTRFYPRFHGLLAPPDLIQDGRDGCLGMQEIGIRVRVDDLSAFVQCQRSSDEDARIRAPFGINPVLRDHGLFADAPHIHIRIRHPLNDDE